MAKQLTKHVCVCVCVLYPVGGVLCVYIYGEGCIYRCACELVTQE